MWSDRLEGSRTLRAQSRRQLKDMNLFRQQCYIDGRRHAKGGTFFEESSKYGIEEFLEVKYLWIGGL